MQQTIFDIHTLEQLTAVAQTLAERISHPAWVYLYGDLGLGKTTFAQRFIAAKGCSERVTSPTYALMQDYHTATGTVIHCDLYRLADPEELYEIGLLETSSDEQAIVLLEWPGKGQGVIPAADVSLYFEMTDKRQQLRRLRVQFADTA